MPVDRFPGSGRQAYLAARQQRRDEAQAEDRAVRPLAPPEECCSEEDIRKRKPRILITNFRQLEILTTRMPDLALFAEAPLRYFVFDEAHTYSGCHRGRGRLPDPAGAGPGREDAPTRSSASGPRPPSPTRPRGSRTTTRRPAASPPVLRRGRTEGRPRRRVLRQPGVAPPALQARRPARRRHGPPHPCPGGDRRAGEPGDDQGSRRGTHRADLRAGRRLARSPLRPPRRQRVRLPGHPDLEAPQVAQGCGLADLAADRHESAGRGRPGQRRTPLLPDPRGRRPQGRRVAAAAQGPLLPPWPRRDGRRPRRDGGRPRSPTSSCRSTTPRSGSAAGTTTPSCRC